MPRDQYLQEAIEMLDQRFDKADGDTAAAFAALTTTEKRFVDEELDRCARDPSYYSHNYHWIQSKHKGDTLFDDWWESQELFYATVMREIAAKGKALIACVKARQIGGCLDPETPVLTEKWEWIPLKNVRVGQKLVATEEEGERGATVAEVLATTEVVQPGVRVTMDDGRTLCGTLNHRMLMFSANSFTARWRSLSDTIVGDKIAWLSEGHTSRYGEPSLESGWATIARIELVPAQRFVDLQTTTKTYIANGFVSHNSTICSMLSFHRTIFTPACTTLIVAQDPGQSGHLFKWHRFAYDSLPWWMRPEVRYEQKGLYMEFDRKDPEARRRNPGLRSAIYVESALKMSGVAVGRGLVVTHMSEISRWPDAKVLMDQIFPAMGAPNELAFMESTALGEDQFWFNTWCSVVDGELGDWTPVFIPAWRIKHYSIPIPASEVFALTEEESAIKAKVEREEHVVLQDGYFNWRRQTMRKYERVSGDEGLFYQNFPGCLVAGTLVSTERGIIPIEQAGDCKMSESGPIEAWHALPPQRVYTLLTKQGRTLTGTADHPVMTKTGWKPLGELAKGETICLRPPRFADDYWTEKWSDINGAETRILVNEDWGLFLGYFVGDGSYYAGDINVCCTGRDADVHADVAAVMESVIAKPKAQLRHGKDGRLSCCNVRVHCTAALPYLRRFGVIHEGGAWPKRLVAVPPAIFKSPRSVVRAFLSGLFEADGSSGSWGIVSMSTIYESFAVDVQQLLLGFGIGSTIDTIYTKPKKDSVKRFKSFFVRLNTAGSDRFRSEIGFRGSRKQNARAPKKGGGNGRPPAPAVFDDEVSDVKASGEAPVYDFTIAGEHAFSANGILTHNTSWVEAFTNSGTCAYDRKRLQTMLERDACNPKWAGEVIVDYRQHPENARVVGNAVNPDDHMTTWKKVGQRFRIWEEPEAGESYYIGMDPSMGLTGRDASAIVVLRIGRVMEADSVAATWHGWVGIKELCWTAYKIGTMYNGAEIALEVDGVGQAASAELYKQLEYPAQYRYKHYDKIRGSLTNFVGWQTTGKTRPLLINKMKEYVQADQILIRDQDLLTEMKRFASEDGGRFEGTGGQRDDLNFAALIALFCAHDSDYGIAAMSAPRQPSRRGNAMRAFQGLCSVRGRDLTWLDGDRFDQQWEASTRIKVGELWCTLASRPESMVKLRILQELPNADKVPFVCVPRVRDFYNTNYSPIHDAPRSRQAQLHYDEGVPEEYVAEVMAHMGPQEGPPEASGREDDWMVRY